MIIGHNPLVNVINWRIVLPGGAPAVDNAHRPRILFPLPSAVLYWGLMPRGTIAAVDTAHRPRILFPLPIAILYWGLMPRGSGGVAPSTGQPQNRQFLADVGFLMGR